MIAIKSDAMERMPKYCDDCIWYGTRPHPHKGWTDMCELMGRCMDDDQEEEWIYDGNGRPKACPLIEVADTPQTESTGSPIGDYRDGVGAWQTDCPWK